MPVPLVRATKTGGGKPLPSSVVILSEGAYRKQEERARNTSDRVEGSLSDAGCDVLLFFHRKVLRSEVPRQARDDKYLLLGRCRIKRRPRRGAVGDGLARPACTCNKNGRGKPLPYGMYDRHAAIRLRRCTPRWPSRAGSLRPGSGSGRRGSRPPSAPRRSGLPPLPRGRPPPGPG